MNPISPPYDTIKFNNIANNIGFKNDTEYFDWMVYVNEDEEVLDHIEKVEYLLHHTFPNPLRIGSDRTKNFSISSSGWGEFYIRITVFFANKSRLDMNYMLDLSKGWKRDLFV